jgi:hypothetical protein
VNVAPVDDSLLQQALETASESASIDFKSSIDLASAGDWLSLLKDIAAFANSGGGVIVFGLDDGGKPVGRDVSAVIATDPADISNWIYKYTNSHFHDFKIVGCTKSEAQIAALLVGPSKVPMVFTRVGTFEPKPGQQKTLFSLGTIYFRHGAKSEPAASEDLQAFIDRKLEEIKRSWLEGITRVVEAPPGSRIAFISPEAQPADARGALPLRLTDDPAAPAYYAVPIDTTHPFRQKEIVVEVNKRIGERRRITSHDILCIRRVYEVHKDIRLCYTQNYASPRYSPAFVDWIASQYEADNKFFDSTKKRFDELKEAL